MSYGATTRITTCDCHDKMYSIRRHSLRNHNPSSMVWSTRLRTSQCLLLKTADSCQTFRVRLGALERIVANRNDESLPRTHVLPVAPIPLPRLLRAHAPLLLNTPRPMCRPIGIRLRIKLSRGFCNAPDKSAYFQPVVDILLQAPSF
jgi:hypothetical protein